MPLRAVHSDSGTFDWYCAACGHVHQERSLDPADGHLHVHTFSPDQSPPKRRNSSTALPAGLTVTCELCRATESFRRDVHPCETGAVLHPDSLVGTLLPGGNVIISDHRPGSGVIEPLTAEHAEQAYLIRAMQAHPKLAAHAPLPDHPSKPHPFAVLWPFLQRAASDNAGDA